VLGDTSFESLLPILNAAAIVYFALKGRSIIFRNLALFCGLAYLSGAYLTIFTEQYVELGRYIWRLSKIASGILLVLYVMSIFIHFDGDDDDDDDGELVEDKQPKLSAQSSPPVLKTHLIRH
jgi:hypothetical protein